jgi:hypothetical protein
VHALYVEQSRGGEADKEAQAREQYFFFRSEVEQALTDVYRCENRLRYMMGITASDGRLIRPADEPTTARIAFDWQQSLVEALSRSAELRKQKWVIKQRELELTAAKNLLLPRLDLVGRWRFLGTGKELINQDYQPFPQPGPIVGGQVTDSLEGTDAYSSLLSGKYQEWQAGAQFLMPLGFRREMATVRHFQLSLARERARLQDEELEASHALVEAVRNVDTNFSLSQTNFNRRVAAERQVEAVQAAYDAGTVTLDQLLDAQRRRAEAESSYYRALVDYNRSISQLHYRKGSLLEYNGVFLAEGPWPGKAYFDARGRVSSAAERSRKTLKLSVPMPRPCSCHPVTRRPAKPSSRCHGCSPARRRKGLDMELPNCSRRRPRWRSPERSPARARACRRRWEVATKRCGPSPTGHRMPCRRPTRSRRPTPPRRRN